MQTAYLLPDTAKILQNVYILNWRIWVSKSQSIVFLSGPIYIIWLVPPPLPNLSTLLLLRAHINGCKDSISLPSLHTAVFAMWLARFLSKCHFSISLHLNFAMKVPLANGTKEMWHSRSLKAFGLALYLLGTLQLLRKWTQESLQIRKTRS